MLMLPTACTFSAPAPTLGWPVFGSFAPKTCALPLARTSVSGPVTCSGSIVSVPRSSAIVSGPPVWNVSPCAVTVSGLKFALPESAAGVFAGPLTVMVPAISDEVAAGIVPGCRKLIAF